MESALDKALRDYGFKKSGAPGAGVESTHLRGAGLTAVPVTDWRPVPKAVRDVVKKVQETRRLRKLRGGISC